MSLGRHRVVAGGGVLVLLVVALVAVRTPRVPHELPALRAGEVWIVALRYPEGDWSGCFDDDSVAQALMTADLPVSAATATLGPDAREADVHRILACVDRRLTGGTITVTAHAVPEAPSPSER